MSSRRICHPDASVARRELETGDSSQIHGLASLVYTVEKQWRGTVLQGMWVCTPLISALGSQRQVDLCDFEACLVYILSSTSTIKNKLQQNPKSSNNSKPRWMPNSEGEGPQNESTKALKRKKNWKEVLEGETLHAHRQAGKWWKMDILPKALYRFHSISINWQYYHINRKKFIKLI